MAYGGVPWTNKPSHASPINANNLEIMDNELVYLDDKSHIAENELVEITENGVGFCAGNFVRGNFKSDGTINYDVHYRVITEDVVVYDRPISVHVSDNFWADFNLFDETGTVPLGEIIQFHSVKTGTVPANTHFKLLIRRATENTSEVCDIPTFVKQLTIKTVSTEQIEDLEEDVETHTNQISTLNQDVEDVTEIVDEKLMTYVPLDRQLFDVSTMIPTNPLDLTVDSHLDISKNSGFRMYVVEVNALAGETYTFNFCSNTSGDPQLFNSASIHASNSYPVAGGTVLQTGAANASQKRGTITLNQNSKYLIIRVSCTSSTYPGEPYTADCNALVGHLVLRKGSTYDTTYYAYLETEKYYVIPYYQGIAAAGKTLKVDENGYLVLSNSGGTDEERVRQIIQSMAVLLNQGSENNNKILGVGNDGIVTLFENSGGGTTPDVAVRLHNTKTLYVGSDVLTDASAVLGTGWSGNLTSGYTHTTGNTDDLYFNLDTDSGAAYIITLETSSATEDRLLLSIGNSPKADPYNGTNTMYVGIVSDGGYFRVSPKTTFSGTIKLKLQKVQNSGEELTFNTFDVNCGQTTANLSGFWNVGISSDALQNNQNGSRNVAIGRQSMYLFKSGTRNVCVGTFSMPFVQQGDRNVAIGADTIYGGVAGEKKAYDNIAIGKAAMYAGSEINRNIAIGTTSMGSNTDTAHDNVVVGDHAGTYADAYNTHVGVRAGYYNKGTGNVSLGYQAGSDLYNTGNNNICIGAQAGIKDPTSSSSDIKTINNGIAIGFNVKVTKSNQVKIGDSTQEIVLGDKKLVFNQDGTVSWVAL